MKFNLRDRWLDFVVWWNWSWIGTTVDFCICWFWGHAPGANCCPRCGACEYTDDRAWLKLGERVGAWLDKMFNHTRLPF